MQSVGLKITKIWQHLDIKEEINKHLVGLVQKSNEHSNILVQIQQSQYVILHFAVRILQQQESLRVYENRARQTGPIPSSQPGAGQSGALGASISGYPAPLWGWAKAESQWELGLPWPLARQGRAVTN